MLDLLTDPSAWLAFVTLSLLEIVLGIDNIIFISILVMMVVSGAISAFVDRHPTIKILALSFLILIGVALVAEGAHFEIPKGYLYFAMAFSVVVEMINIRLRKLLDSSKPKADD